MENFFINMTIFLSVYLLMVSSVIYLHIHVIRPRAVDALVMVAIKYSTTHRKGDRVAIERLESYLNVRFGDISIPRIAANPMNVYHMCSGGLSVLVGSFAIKKSFNSQFLK